MVSATPVSYTKPTVFWLNLLRHPIAVISGNLGFSAAVFTALSLLMSAFALLIPPAGLTTPPSTAYRTLLYQLHKV
eukprot:IDg6257t1